MFAEECNDKSSTTTTTMTTTTTNSNSNENGVHIRVGEMVARTDARSRTPHINIDSHFSQEVEEHSSYFVYSSESVAVAKQRKKKPTTKPLFATSPPFFTCIFQKRARMLFDPIFAATK